METHATPKHPDLARPSTVFQAPDSGVYRVAEGNEDLTDLSSRPVLVPGAALSVQDSQRIGTGTAAVAAVLGDAARIARSAHALLSPVGQARSELRQRLIDDGRIIRIDPATPVPCSVAAVDGGQVKQTLYAADLLVVIAVAAEGMTSNRRGTLGQSHWCEVVPHSTENGALISVAMASHELDLLNRLDHDLRLIDGSLTSQIITLSVGLNTHQRHIQDHVVSLITDDVLNAVWNLASPQHRPHPGHIAALPKSDTGDKFATGFARDYDLALPGGDRFLAASVLDPGEMLYPRPLVEHTHPPTSIPKDAPEHVTTRAYALAEAVGSVKEAASKDRLVATYVKPVTADTVVKIETLTSEPLVDWRARDHGAPALNEVRALARRISDETPGPHMQEPFAQYAVDLAAKQVSVAADALNQSMLANLPEDAGSYLSLLARSCRTTTGSGGRGGALGGPGGSGGPGAR